MSRWVNPFGRPVNAAIKAHAAENLDVEICGAVVVQDGTWHYERLANMARDKANRFHIDEGQLLALGPVAAIVHSHPQGPAFPSFADMRQQAAMALPWGIVVPAPHADEGLFWFGDGITYPLMKRCYRHGVTDCYALVRDWYAAQMQVSLIDQARGWQWWQQGEDLYTSSLAKAGFSRLDEAAVAQPGDVALAAILSPVVNHALIWVDAGLVLHHPAGRHGFDPIRLPRIEPAERWRRYIRFWVRHNSARPPTSQKLSPEPASPEPLELGKKARK